MQKRNLKKLSLSRETVRKLTQEELGRIVGGNPTWGCPLKESTTCPPSVPPPCEFTYDCGYETQNC